MILIVLTIGVFALAVYIEFKRLTSSQRYKHIAGIPEIPLIGNALTLKGIQVNDHNTVFQFLNFAKLAKVYIFHVPVFLISDPDVLQIILNGDNFRNWPFFADFFHCPNGIIAAKYDSWKPLRKALNPAFSQRVGLSFIPIFEKHFKNFVDEIYKQNGDVFDLSEIAIRIMSNVTLETNFGVEDANEVNFDLHAMEKMIDNVCYRISKLILFPNFIYKMSSLYKEDKAVLAKIRKSFELMIANRKKYWESHETDSDAPNGGKLFIDYLQKYTEYFDTDDCLIENMMTIFIAGHETSSLTVLYTILLIAMHPEVDKKLEKELFEHYEPGQHLNVEALKKFTYLDMVIKETMRLLPAAPVSSRQCRESAILDKIGFVEKGTTFMLSYYNLHRWKDFWGEDANEFNPEHFSPKNCEKRHPYAYLPFSGGPKVCIAHQYAMIAVKVGLIMVLSEFKFNTNLKLDELNFKYCITLKITNDCLVTATQRKRTL